MVTVEDDEGALHHCEGVSYNWDPSWDPSKFAKNVTNVVGAAHGLVCVSSADLLYSSCLEVDKHNYCVVDPLTSTWTVLPPLPFAPQGGVTVVDWLPTTTEVAMIAHTCRHADADVDALLLEWAVATCTYDLTEAGGCGGTAKVWSVAQGFMGPRLAPNSDRARNEGWTAPRVTLCGGRTFCYCWDRRVHVHERGKFSLVPPERWIRPPWIRALWISGAFELVEAAALDPPSVELLGLRPPERAGAVEYLDKDVFLAAHRGDVFFVARLRPAYVAAGVVAGVWRLANAAASEPMAMYWEPVARLEVQDVARVMTNSPVHMRKLRVLGVSPVRKLLCCSLRVKVGMRNVIMMMGLDLDIAQWKLLQDHKKDLEALLHLYDGTGYPIAMGALPLELKPDMSTNQAPELP